jgi:YVTN family beta-propeller protein
MSGGMASGSERPLFKSRGITASQIGNDGFPPNSAGGDGTVSVIATATNRVTATITVGTDPSGLAVTPDGSKVYVT